MSRDFWRGYWTGMAFGALPFCTGVLIGFYLA